MGKKNDNTLVKNASFLMVAALISKIIGMLYKSPLSTTLGSQSFAFFFMFLADFSNLRVTWPPELNSQRDAASRVPLVISNYSLCTLGNFIQISVPFPSSLLSITHPFRAPTACFTIESPSPVPPISLE